MKPDIQKTIVDAIDKVCLQFTSDNEIIFNDELDRRKLKYSLLSKMSDWHKSKKCIVEECHNQSIIRSHTIQRSGSLGLIAEGNHLLHPRFHIDKEELVIDPISVNAASTFPGFCEHHEKLFEPFEKTKRMNQPDHFRLQVYRTVCREIVKWEFSLEMLRSRFTQYRDFRDRKIQELFVRELGEPFLSKHNISMKGLRFKNNDFRQQSMEAQISFAEENIDNFLKPFKKAIYQEVVEGASDLIFGAVQSLDVKIPVALAGRANFHIGEAGKSRNVDVIINILPFENETFAVISGLAKDAQPIQMYFNKFADPLNFINMVESWMVYGSDHWFVTPSVWNSITGTNQAKVLSAISDTDTNIGYLCPFSIFNNLKRQIIALLEENYVHLTPNQRKLIEIEKSKLTDT